MGMDVHGKNATSETGAYFRNNCWWWRPLWDYCESVSFVAQQVEYAQSNSGDGLDAEDARTLAETLFREIDAGRTLKYEQAYNARLAALPDVACEHCHGTGQRNDAYVQGECNGCAGQGQRRPFETYYPFTVENVREFAAFLQASGGFEIW